MNCPVCHIVLTKAELLDANIDYCPHCKGIWIKEEELETVFKANEFDVKIKTNNNLGGDIFIG